MTTPLFQDKLNELQKTEPITTKEADGQDRRVFSFYPEITNQYRKEGLHLSHKDLLDQEIIIYDGMITLKWCEFPHNDGSVEKILKETAIILASLAIDRWDKSKWFKFMSSATVIVDQIRRYSKIKKDTAKNSFPIQGIIHFDNQLGKKSRPMWYLNTD
jgi:hypothetical protein